MSEEPCQEPSEEQINSSVVDSTHQQSSSELTTADAALLVTQHYPSPWDDHANSSQAEAPAQPQAGTRRRAATMQHVALAKRRKLAPSGATRPMVNNPPDHDEAEPTPQAAFIARSTIHRLATMTTAMHKGMIPRRMRPFHRCFGDGAPQASVRRHLSVHFKPPQQRLAQCPPSPSVQIMERPRQ
jgi:hypothetical protein